MIKTENSVNGLGPESFNILEAWNGEIRILNLKRFRMEQNKRGRCWEKYSFQDKHFQKSGCYVLYFYSSFREITSEKGV